MADNDGWTALHFSARYGSYELFRYIVQTGADIYLKTHRGSNCSYCSMVWAFESLQDPAR